jgi:histone H3/H4
MRYLYGDSAPFPQQYNFLQTLETFVSAATRAARLDAEARSIQDKTADTAVQRAKSVVALEAYHQQVMRYVQESAAQSPDPQVVDYARQVLDQAVRFVEDAKRTTVTAAEREQATARIEIDRRKAEIRDALQGFLLVGRLSILESRVAMNLIEGRNDVSAVFTHPDGIITAFTLSVADSPAWQVPRKVADFAAGVDLMIGVKKSLFKRTVAPEAVHLDEYLLSGFDMSDDVAEIRLRRKLADAREAFVFKLRRVDTEILAEVQRPGEVEAESGPPAVDSGDRQQLERLWQLIRAGVADVLAHKERLISVSLDGQDLFEQGLSMPFIERLLRLLCPTVNEIARRSPNASELSLKTEDDHGRREEIYVKKEDLAAHIEPLGEREKALFLPLKLLRDQWGQLPSTLVMLPPGGQ